MYIWICIYIWKQSITNIYNSTTLKNVILVAIQFTIHLNELGRLTFWRFGISKYYEYSLFRITFQCHWAKKIETIYFRIDGCQIWKIYIQLFQINSLVLRIINEQDKTLSHFPWSVASPSVMDCNEGRSIQIISFKFIQYFRLL